MGKLVTTSVRRALLRLRIALARGGCSARTLGRPIGSVA